ncbi:MAG: 50S ribosomal protein L15 [candidate division TM6 bacterium GW2011_GWF2_37_49]|nr:MAG: 50S ribosomal protein L15 [candidate division TM6 bacterium GW2011_GWF2_37_49]
MLHLDKLTPIIKKRKKLGRGGDLGGTSGRGHKGQKARTGGRFELGPLFEGGQMPLSRRIPRRGFNNNAFRKEFIVINLQDLENKFQTEDVVNFETLKSKNLINGKHVFVKILGQGDLTKKLTVQADAFSKTAIQAIQKAGGTVELIKEFERGGTTA